MPSKDIKNNHCFKLPQRQRDDSGEISVENKDGGFQDTKSDNEPKPKNKPLQLIKHRHVCKRSNLLGLTPDRGLEGKRRK